MNKRRQLTEQLDALSIYHYLMKYSELEELVKQLFIEEWINFNDKLKQRIMFYQGGLVLENGFIEYDTYSVVTQYHKFDAKALLNKMTLNQIIKIERKEKQIAVLQCEIVSLQNKRTVYVCQDCILKLLSMRNILAHKMSDLNFKNKDYIDVLNNEIIGKSNLNWLWDYDLNLFSEPARCIVSNYVYMDIIYRKIRGSKNVKAIG